MPLIFSKTCSKCGVKQTKDGECWDYSKCSKCFNKESITDIVGFRRRKFYG